MKIRLKYKIWLKYKTRFKYKTWFKYKNLGHGPYGPGPIWAPGPWAPGPSLLGKHPPKNAPWKKESKLCFLCVFWKQKRCATSVRSFWRRYRAEISAMSQKTKDSIFQASFIILPSACPLLGVVINTAGVFS